MNDLTNAALEGWIAWIDDLPLPPEFQDGLDGLQDAITALRAERDAWKAQCEAVEREAAKCFSAQEEIDAAWDAFGTSGNRKVLSLAEQIASHQREVDDARAAYARGAHDAASIVRSSADLYASKDADFICQSAALDIEALADAPPAPQCCMCGKKGLSTVEGDGGTECGLDDGRWVCSAECYDRAYPDATPAPVVRVRPLVWTLSVSGVWCAASIAGRYMVSDSQWFRTGLDEWVWVDGGDDAAKAAAQADYEARILAALQPQAGGGDA